ncbi:MAG: glycosyl transferase family 1, partial [Bacteroidota bacterium]
MNVLMLSATFPYPPTRGGTSVRTFNLLKHLKKQGHQISLGTLRSDDVSDAEVNELKDWVDELGVFAHGNEAQPGSGSLGKVKRLMSFALGGTPPSVMSRHSAAMQAWVDEKISSGLFDAITAEHCVNEVYVPADI